MSAKKENVRRRQACLKVCEGMPTDELESLASVGGLPALKTGIEVQLGWWKECDDQRLLLKKALINALEWIDAVPAETQLPAMPGFDRDEVNQLISDIKKDRL